MTAFYMLMKDEKIGFVYAFKGPFLALCAAWIVVASAQAQYYRMEFGENGVQYKAFNWKYYSAENFDVYYHRGGQSHARDLIKHLQEQYETLVDFLGYSPYFKISIFLFNSHHDIRQSNVGLENVEYTMGGEADFSDLYVSIAHPGTRAQFNLDIKYQLTLAFVQDMHAGGRIRDFIRGTYLLHLPEWYIDGVSRYLAYGWDNRMDAYAREHVPGALNPALLTLSSKYDQGLIGQSIWNYVAVKYGEDTISNLLNLTRITSNEKSVFGNILGLPMISFLDEWQQFYKAMDESTRRNYSQPAPDQIVYSSKSKRTRISSIRFSPSGDKIAFVTDRFNKFRVLTYDLETRSASTVAKFSSPGPSQSRAHSPPIIDWVNDNRIVGVYNRRGSYRLWEASPDGKGFSERILRRLDHINDFDVNDNGRLALMSGLSGGRVNLYLLHLKNRAKKRISADGFDNIHPSFLPNSTSILFSSNRTLDSLKFLSKKKHEPGEFFGLFLFDLDTTRVEYSRLTRLPANLIRPRYLSDNQIVYLSDQNGFYNLFRLHLQDTLYWQLTNFSSSMQHYDVSASRGSLVYSTEGISGGGDSIYYVKDFDFHGEVVGPLDPGARPPGPPGKPGSSRRENFPSSRVSSVVEVAMDGEDSPPDREAQLAGASPSPQKLPESDGDILQREMPHDGDSPAQGDFAHDQSPAGESGVPVDGESVDMPSSPPPASQTTPTGEEDIFLEPEDFRFSIPQLSSTGYAKVLTSPRVGNSILDRFQVADERVKNRGPFNYFPIFNIDNFITSVVFDPLRNFGLLFESQLSDILQNHRLIVSAMVRLDFNGGDLFVDYQHLKFPVDFRVRYERGVYLLNGELFDNNDNQRFYTQKYQIGHLYLGVSYPLTSRLRIEAAPFYSRTNFINFLPAAVNPLGAPPNVEIVGDETRHYYGSSLKIVFDNTRGIQTLRGTRGRLKLDSYFSSFDSDLNFSKMNFEIRHYQPIYRNISLAGKVFYGQSFGNNRQYYMIGGIANAVRWRSLQNGLGNSESTDNPIVINSLAPNPNLLFAEFVTPLRGYDFNHNFGQGASLLSLELRVPIFSVLIRSSIASQFVRNFSIIGFFDVGSTWDRIPPFFSSGLKGRSRTYRSDPFTFEVLDYSNPWVGDYGFGMRTVLFQYYFKLDFARRAFNVPGSDDWHPTLSFGTDF